MPNCHLLAIPAFFILLTLLTPQRAAPREELILEQIIELADQAERAFHDRLRDYTCQVTTTVREPSKDGPGGILRIEEKTVYRKLPDKRLEKFNAIRKKEKVFSQKELIEYEKKQRLSISSFVSPGPLPPMPPMSRESPASL